MLQLPPKYAGRAALSPEEAAETLGISEATFYRRVMPHVYSGAILSMKVGARRCIIVSSFLAWVEQQIDLQAA